MVTTPLASGKFILVGSNFYDLSHAVARDLRQSRCFPHRVRVRGLVLAKELAPINRQIAMKPADGGLGRVDRDSPPDRILDLGIREPRRQFTLDHVSRHVLAPFSVAQE
jgi:hypothetical protein